MLKLTPRDFPKDPVSRVDYLQQNFDISDPFFLTLLKISEEDFGKWRRGEDLLSSDALEILDSFWNVMVDLRDLWGNENAALKDIFDCVARQDPASKPVYHKHMIPWVGMSIKGFIESRGTEALNQINIWTHGFKFG